MRKSIFITTGAINSSQRRVSVGRSKTQNDSNPFDAEGNIMQCHECDSTKHFLNDCPHRHVEDAKMAVHIALIAGSASKQQDVMLEESLARGILLAVLAPKQLLQEFGLMNMYLC